MGELVTGQMRETVGPLDGDDPVVHYLAVIGQKTGSLIATAGRYGGMFSGAPAEHIEALHRFGELIGTAFQISDDIIDIASPADESGKTPGTDLREGVLTLPMLYALSPEYTGGEPDPRLRELLAAPITDDDLVDEALTLLRKSPGLEQAVAHPHRVRRPRSRRAGGAPGVPGARSTGHAGTLRGSPYPVSHAAVATQRVAARGTHRLVPASTPTAVA